MQLAYHYQIQTKWDIIYVLISDKHNWQYLHFGGKPVRDCFLVNALETACWLVGETCSDAQVRFMRDTEI